MSFSKVNLGPGHMPEHPGMLLGQKGIANLLSDSVCRPFWENVPSQSHLWKRRLCSVVKDAMVDWSSRDSVSL